MDRSFLSDGREVAAERGPAGLNVFWTVPEALDDMDRKAVRAPKNHLAVHPRALPRLEIDPQNSNIRALDEAVARRVSVDRPRVYVERTGVGGANEARLPGQHRSPGPARGIDGAEDKERERREEFPMVLRQVVADHLAAQPLDLVPFAEPGLDLNFAPVKR
ncbi:MAG: hypothetical protein IIA34_04705 [Proteobacteria bacterium]|nr:hypothetical protein [Pseudomonadota bacterium]